MGCEADIEFARVDSGEFLISDDEKKYPQFVVREPVAVLYAPFLSLGPWVNVRLPEEFESHLAYTNDSRLKLVVVPDTLGLLVVQQSWIEKHRVIGKEWRERLENEALHRAVYEQGLELHGGDSARAYKYQSEQDLPYVSGKHIPDGAKSLTYLKSHWDQLTPGRWVVTRYSESGTENDRYYHAHLPNGVVLGTRVRYEIWT